MQLIGRTKRTKFLSHPKLPLVCNLETMQPDFDFRHACTDTGQGKEGARSGFALSLASAFYNDSKMWAEMRRMICSKKAYNDTPHAHVIPHRCAYNRYNNDAPRVHTMTHRVRI